MQHYKQVERDKLFYKKSKVLGEEEMNVKMRLAELICK